MFQKILIANRGEIACRVASTAKRMGIQTVAVYSDADASAKHVLMCDEAVHLGGSAPNESYLRWEKIIEAVQATGAQAIHPGYGFLSENQAFAKACQQAGLIFIGPPASAIEAMGLKAASKQLMEKAKVPLVPGYHGADQSPSLLKQEANRIGYPVLIKASAGGGGKGMRIVEHEKDFETSLASCQREATSSFGDAAVLIEKYVQRPRHIEIQIFADTQGDCVYLFERDCSVQRRHQKVLEEAPAPGLTNDMRERMGQAAVAAAQAVKYVGAGTVEFIVEQSEKGMQFFFMEMNTRLQVEHPVTEAITGLDLVEWQLRIASGEALPLKQDQLKMKGHAIEARICAENPDRDFLPATGSLDVYKTPQASSFAVGEVRVDDGFRQGDVISPYYDSMIAKLIVHGDTREQALARLDQALSQFHVVGVANNISFLRRVLKTQSFSKPHLDTTLIDREKNHLFHQQSLSLDVCMVSTIAQMLLQEFKSIQVNTRGWVHPFANRDAWSPWNTSQRQFEIKSGDAKCQGQLSYLHHGGYELSIDNSKPFTFEFQAHQQSMSVRWGDQTWNANVYLHGSEASIFTSRGECRVQWVDALRHQHADVATAGRLTAPMPGKVIAFHVKAGDSVKKGQVLAVMEAMKMEHTLASPADGAVAELLFAVGDQVAEGLELLKIDLTS
ncbi:MAG: acetyl/propionyl/methylcrotonyl-CoA carboxylase subunit alpha [Limnohabitans sp.]|nr:acetyl/propionyl/methylcrotonyl-CoA carboxylase subunit alpha [Limnohabitans sp.]